MESNPGSCQIHLKEEARLSAACATYPIPAFDSPCTHGNDPERYLKALSEHSRRYGDEYEARRAFTGPHFKDCVKSVDFLTPGWVHVELEDGNMYSYPSTDVARVKTYRS